MTYISVGKIPGDTDRCASVYNDGKYCPVCGGRLKYYYHHFNHIGKFYCGSCGFSSPEAGWTVTDADFASGSIELNGSTTLSVKPEGMTRIYNILGAVAVCNEADIEMPVIINAVEDLSLIHI